MAVVRVQVEASCFVKMGTKGKLLFLIYQTLCTVLSHTNLLTWYKNLVQKE